MSNWLDENGFFLFGKHSDEEVNDVAQEDSPYLHWILDNVDDIDEEDREVIKSALKFRKHKRA